MLLFHLPILKEIVDSMRPSGTLAGDAVATASLSSAIPLITIAQCQYDLSATPSFTNHTYIFFISTVFLQWNVAINEVSGARE